jgi:predicted N-acetyltransferase YhbS
MAKVSPQLDSKMQIDVIHETHLTAAQDAEIAALLAQCFDTDFGGRSFFQQRHHMRVIARAPHLVGHMALTMRAVRIGEVLSDVIGLAEVATSPSHRGQGIAAALLHVAIAEARESMARYVFLFGNAQLYAAAGFVPVTNSVTWTDLSGARTGAVCTNDMTHLMALPLRGDPVDPAAPIDLLGHAF